MGINCEINLNKPADGVFIPGTKIEGVIKYAFDEDTTIEKIIISLKGSGCLQIKNTRKKRSHRCVYRKNETYVDIDHVIEDNEKIFPIGSYETCFSFRFPANLPSTLNYFKKIPFNYVRCIIGYYIRIKFESTGMFKFNKHFKKDITVVSGITPRYPTIPTNYGEQKNLFHLCSCMTSVVKMEANFQSCVITPGGKIELDYEVVNNSLVTVKGVEFKLVEMYTFKPRIHVAARAYEDVIDSYLKTSSIGVGETQKMRIVINVPTEKTSMENSDMVSRDYYVQMSVVLPMPHTNAILEIPVQIGYHYKSDAPLDNQYNPSAPTYTPDDPADNQYNQGALTNANSYDNPPPSYWEVMGEHNEDNEKDEDYNYIFSPYLMR